MTRLGTEFIPIMDEGAFDMDVSLLPGVSLDKAMEINKLAAEKLKSFPNWKRLSPEPDKPAWPWTPGGSIKPATWGF